MMKLKNLSITNYRGIEKLQYSPKKINIIVGRNNSGKTSVMAAINNLLTCYIPSSSAGYPQFEIKNGKDKAIIESETQKIEIYRDIDSLDSKLQTVAKEKISSLITGYFKEYNLEDRRKFLDLVYENFDFSVLVKSDQKIYLNPYFKNSRNLDKAKEHFDKELKKVFKNNKEVENTVIYVDFLRPFWRDALTEITESKNNVVELSYEAFYEPTFLHDIKYLGELEEFIKKAKLLPQFEKLTDYGIINKEKGDSSWLPYTSYGTGLIVLLNIIYHIIKAKNGILLIEEPENHLHPGYIKEITEKIFLLSKKFNVQIFITTHSFDLIQEIMDYAETTNQGKLILISRLVSDKGQIKIFNYDFNEANKTLNVLKLDLRGI